MKGIIETLDKWMQPFKDFIIDNHSNPLLWLAIFAIGLLVFKTVHTALQKEK